MKTNRKLTLVAVFLLMICEVAFGQTYLSIGSDPLNPNLDPLLMAHAWYGQTSIEGSGWNFTLPAKGITGTSGVFKLGGSIVIGSSDKCDGTNSAIARIQTFENSGNITVGGNGHLFYNNNGGRAISGANTQVANVYDSVVVDGVTYNRNPQLPDFNSITFPGTQTALNLNGSSITLDPGVHYYASIYLNTGAKVNIKPGKTVIYVQGNMSDAGSSNEIRYVKADGTPMTDLCNADDWDVLFIVGGNVTFNSGSTKANGTFIAPNGTISTGSGSIEYNGQILANKLSFTNSYNASTQMRFIPFPTITDPVKITPADLTFTREQCGANYNAQITIALPTTLTGTQTVSFNYQIVPISPASVGSTGTDAIITTDKMSGTINYTVSSQSAFVIPLTIVNDGTTFYQNKTFEIRFSNITTSGISMELPETAVMKINMSGTEQNKPSTPNWTATTVGGVYEKPTAIGSGASVTAAGQTAGTLSGSITNTGNTIVYRFSSTNTNTSADGFFEIDASGVIKTTGNYNADYEAKKSYQYDVYALAAANLDCVEKSDVKSITINILPWNDNEMTFNPNGTSTGIAGVEIFNGVRITTDENVAKTFDGKVIVASDADAGGTNIQKVISVTQGAYGKVTFSGNSITYTPTSDVTVEVLTDNFIYVIRDTAEYANGVTYNSLPNQTAYFDKTVNVTVNLTPVDDNAPVVSTKNVELFENSKIEIAIGDIAITDADDKGGNPAHYTHTFVDGSWVLSGNVTGAKVSIVNGKLVYDLTGVAKSVEIFSDVITYKIKDSKNEAEGKIIVTIKHKNDIAPVANDDVVTAYVGVTTSDTTLTSNDTDADVIPIGKKAEIQINDIVSQPSNSKITVTKIDAKTVSITIASDYDPDVDGYTATFTYNIQDPTDYDTDVNISANVGTVTINIERMPDDVPIPVSDTIIVNEGESVSNLWNGIASLIANDKASKNGSVVDEAQLVSGAARGTITVNSDGTFEYTDNGNEFPFSDGFTYKVKAANGNWSVIDAYVVVIVNPLNDNAPTLTEKHESVNAKATHNFVVINETDTDIDYVMILKLANSYSDDLNAEVLVVGDSTISFKYNKDVDVETEVKVYYDVKDSVDYKHYYNNSGVFDSTSYNDFTSTKCSLIVTIIPNARAVKDSMAVRELQSTNEFIKADGSKYFSVLDNDLFLSNVKSYTLELKDSTKHGLLEFDANTGRVTYTHENSEELADSFSYYLISVISDDSENITIGQVVISVSPRAPRPDGVSFYEDVNADGTVDNVTISFDRDINDLENTEFEVIFGGITSYNVKAEYAKNEDGTDNKKLIILTEFNAPVDQTSGIMEVNITHNNFADEPVQNVNPEDKAAPVVKNADYIKVPNGNDTLKIVMSEYSQIPNEDGLPAFLFVTANGVMFDEIIDNGDRTYTLVVSKGSSGKISETDFVFVNSLAGVKDIIAGEAKNTQDNPDNKKVPLNIKVTAKIISAVYLDTNNVRDGWIDVISIDLGMDKKIDAEFAQIIADALVLSPTRNFTINAITVTQNGFDLSVTEDKTNEKNTGLLSDDNISVTGLPEFENITIQASEVQVEDGIAPVILHAQYTVNETSKNYLDVVFSEEVSAQNGNPYKFWQINPAPGRNYNMTFETPAKPTQISPNTLRYTVDTSDVPYPVKNDSIWIVNGGVVGDALGNMQDLTVRAPLILTNPYPSDLEVFVVPQPLYMIKAGKGLEAKKLSQNFMEYYGIEGQDKGVAIVLEAKGPVTSLDQRGVVKVIDQLGNAVTDEMEMKFVMTKRGTVAGVVVWDGKNKVGRNVGASTYLAIVEVEVKFDDRDAKEARSYRKIIAVTTAKDVLQ